jgi:hypothetical protein
MKHLLVYPFNRRGNKVDPIMLACQMDAAISVVAAESTRTPGAQNPRDRIADVGGPVVGVDCRRFISPASSPGASRAC